MSADEFEVGDDVILTGPIGSWWVGARGTISNSPGRVFNGWNVRIEPAEGHPVYIGVDGRHIAKVKVLV